MARLLLILLALGLLGGAGYWGSRLLRGRPASEQAAAMLDAGDPKGAQALLRAAVRNEPRNAEAHLLLGRSQLDLSDPLAAEKELKIARVLGTDRAVVNPLLAQAYLAQGRYDDLLADIPATAVRPDEQVADLVARAGAYLAQGDLAEAGASLQDALRAAPGEQGLTNGLAVGLARLAAAQGQLHPALDRLDAVLAAAPRTVDALTAKADVQRRLGNVDGALQTIDAAVAAAPFAIPVRMERANLLIRLGRFKEAHADVDASLAINWHDHSVDVTNALLLLREGRYGDAEVEFQKLVPVMDSYPRAYLYHAETVAAQGRNETAFDILQRFLSLRPRDVMGLRLGAELQLRLQHPDEALAFLRRAEAAGGLDAAALDLMGRAYLVAGHLPEAVAAYRRAVALEPANAAFAAHAQAAERLAGSAPEASVPATDLRP